MPSPASVAEPLFELRHKAGCPASDGRLFGNPQDKDELELGPRKALGIEAYVVTGTGRYNRVSGEFDGVPRAGVVRCIECAEEALVPPETIPAIRKEIPSFQRKLGEERTDA